jgi:hypothetical protein
MIDEAVCWVSVFHFHTATCFTTAKLIAGALYSRLSALILIALSAHAQSLFPLRIKPVVRHLARSDHLLPSGRERKSFRNKTNARPVS